MEGFSLNIKKDEQEYQFCQGDLFAGVALKAKEGSKRELLQFLTGEGSAEDMLDLLISMRAMEQQLVSCISSTTGMPAFLLDIILSIESEERNKVSNGSRVTTTSINMTQMKALKDFVDKQKGVPSADRASAAASATENQATVDPEANGSTANVGEPKG